MFDLVTATMLGKITLIMKLIITRMIKKLHIVFFTLLVPGRYHQHAIFKTLSALFSFLSEVST
jgi:hypothetical protein